MKEVAKTIENTQFYWEEVPALMMKYLTSSNWKTFLDLGCGDGGLLFALKCKGHFKEKIVIAVDISEKRIDNVKRLDEKFRCVVDDACDLKTIEDESVDFLVSSQLIEHVPDDKTMIRQIVRIVRKNGFVYLSTVYKNPNAWYFYRSRGRWTISPDHIREYSQDSQLTDILAEYGLEIIETKKTSTIYPILDFFMARIEAKSEIFERHRLMKTIRRIVKVPVPGYYTWEIVCKKK